MPGNTGKLLRFKVYLEGIRVPFSRGSVGFARNAPPSGSIQVPMATPILGLQDRTHVAVFWYDEVDQQWYLLYDGEARGRGRQKTPHGYGFQIRTTGVTNYWRSVLVYMALNMPPVRVSQVQVFGAVGDLDAKNIFPLAQLVDRKSKLLDGDIEGSFRSILAKIQGINPFYEDAERRLQFQTRIFAAPDTNLKRLVALRDFFEKRFDAHAGTTISDNASIQSFLDFIADFIYYEWLEIPLPIDLEHQIVYKPRLYNAAIPACNFLFPSIYNNLSEDVDFSEEPTRVSAQLNLSMTPGAGSTTAKTYWAPEDVQQAFDSAFADPKKINTSDAATVERIIKEYHAYLTAEERDRGVIHVRADMTQTEYALRAPDQKPDEYLKQLVGFKFFSQRYARRRVQVSGGWFPEPVPGLPIAVIDSYGSPIVGMLDSIVHSFSPRQGSSSFDIGYARYKDDPGAAPEAPSWLNKVYADGSIYEELLGVAAFGGPGMAAFTAAEEMAAEYARARDAEAATAFAFHITKRKKLTEAAYWKALGCDGEENADVRDGPPFREKQRKPIRDYIQEIGGKRGMRAF